ncbi:hypothetical protein [Nonomuraea sp. SYSU D8015]|uniref:hypothetical protein n=1 Tax=Nonomuraea sp. SYSU D8015 TaxID=2593644 RepID=UPI001660D8CD|nr:hypothetical protein [Nonomuraea sp. SYSU D8015]
MSHLANALSAEIDDFTACDCLDKILARARRTRPAATSPTAGPARCVYRTAWRYWAAGVLASFLAIELPGLRTHDGHGTLTAQLRRRRTLAAAAIAAFGAWATVHIGLQGRDT